MSNKRITRRQLSLPLNRGSGWKKFDTLLANLTTAPFADKVDVEELDDLRRFISLVETKEDKEKYLKKTGYYPSPEFHALPFLWHKVTKRGEKSYFLDCLRTVTIIAREAGCDGVLDYISLRNWVCIQDDDELFRLKYTRLSSGRNNTKSDHVKAMVDKLYNILVACKGRLPAGKAKVEVCVLEWARISGSRHVIRGIR